MKHDVTTSSLFSFFLVGGPLGRVQGGQDITPRSNFKAGVNPLRQDTAFLHGQHAPALWRLLSYYVGQQTEASCSLATALMVFNAAQHQQRTRGHRANIWTEDNFFSFVTNPIWYRETRDDGRGITLEQFEEFLRLAATDLGFKHTEISRIHADSREQDLVTARLRSDLRTANKRHDTFIVANFQLSSFVEDLDEGHMSPIGAYDERNGKVLILDVERSQLEPYWVRDTDLVTSMSGVDQESSKARGYLKVTLS